MQISRGRILALGTLLGLYLVGMLWLSAVTLYEPKNGSGFIRGFEQHGQGGANGGLRPAVRRAKLHWCSGLKYLEPPRYPTALVSFPGSGNTWLRYLLQQVTGTYTGSVYKDYGLLKNGFPAESVTNGSVLVVKTHEWGSKARVPFLKAVLLVRSPGAAIQAEFNRQSGGHVGFATPERYRRNKGKYWQNFFTDKLSAWKQTNLDWLHNFTGPTHVIFYDKLVQNVEETLTKLLEFLEFPVTQKNLQCALDRQEGIYRRRKRVLNFDPYTPEMKKILKEEEDKIYRAINTAVRTKR